MSFFPVLSAFGLGLGFAHFFFLVELLFSYSSTRTFDVLSQLSLCHISYRYFFPVCLKTFEFTYNTFGSSENLIFLFK